MKNKLYWLCGLSVILAACQSDDLMDAVVSDADEANFTITLTAPEAMTATRTAQGTNSALGGISNVDMDEYDLRYQLAVYRNTGTDSDGNATYVLAISPQVQVVDEYQTVAYTLRLTPNRTYKFVAWADFVEEGSEDDLHYDTSTCNDNGWVITCRDEEDAQLNDESRDAYYVSSSDLEVTENYSVSLELTRPFAKVRLIATDWGYEDLEMPDNITISYYGCSRFTNIDLFDGTSYSKKLADYNESSTTAYTVTIDKETKNYTDGYDGDDYEVTAGTGASYSYRTLTVDYLMTDATDQTSIHFMFDADDGTTDITSYDFSTDIPIKRNYLTTIIGNLLTTAAAINVWIDDEFDNEYTIPTGEVATYEELQLALALGVEEITLTDDIDTDGEELHIYSTTKTIYLNGYTLTTGGIYYYADDSGSTLTIDGDEESTESASLSTRTESTESTVGATSESKIVDKSSYGITLWGSGAGLVLNNVTLEGYKGAIVMGLDYEKHDGYYDAAEVNSHQNLTIKQSTIKRTYTSGSIAAIHIQSHHAKVNLENSEIISTTSANATGINNRVKGSSPEGCEISLTNSNITTKELNAIQLACIEGGDASKLTIEGGTITSGGANTIELANVSIEVKGATIKNLSSVSLASYGSGIALYPAPTYTQLTGSISDNFELEYEGNVSLSNVTYLLAKASDYYVHYVQICDATTWAGQTSTWRAAYGYIDYTKYAVETSENGTITYGSDGRTDDSTYSYTETTTTE